MKTFFSLAVAAGVLSLAGAQGAGEPPVVSLKFAKPTAKVGTVIDATLTVKFADGLHGYQNPPAEDFQIPVTVKVSEPGFTLVKATYPKGTEFLMAGETKPAKVYQGTISIPLKIKVVKPSKSGSLSIRLDYQECNANACFPPSFVMAKAKLAVVAKKKS